MKRKTWCRALVLTLHWSLVTSTLVTGLTGCESLQRKFVRKSKHPAKAPSPIITFQDYSQAMTPLDRYRKHYLMFDYWNDELLDALQSSPVNPKRYKLASTEALAELKILQGLLAEETAVSLAQLLEERAKIDQRLQRGLFSDMHAKDAARVLETQTRQVRRDFFWRDAQDHLKPPDAQAP